MANEFLESQKKLRDKGIKIDFLNPADNPHRERTNKDLSQAIKADEAKPLFGRGILTPEDRKPNATGKGTGSKTSVGRPNYKPSMPNGGGAKAAPMPKSKPKTAAPAAAKPSKKKAAPAKKKYAEDTQANMTRVGKDKPAAAKGPKRVSPGHDAIMAAQPKRERGGMVIREPTKGYGRQSGRQGK